jgi:hypothetical protein
MPKPILRFVSRTAFDHFMRFTTLPVWLGIHGRYAAQEVLSFACSARQIWHRDDRDASVCFGPKADSRSSRDCPFLNVTN